MLSVHWRETLHGPSGVRPKECVELDQEESTQRTSMHEVNNVGHYCADRNTVKLSVIGCTDQRCIENILALFFMFSVFFFGN